MNLEELYNTLKCRAIMLLNKDGDIIKYLSENKYEKPEIFPAVTNVLIHMVDDFFTDVLNIKPLNEIVIKTDNHNFFIKKLDEEHILCVLSNDSINTSLIKLTLKNNIEF